MTSFFKVTEEQHNAALAAVAARHELPYLRAELGALRAEVERLRELLCRSPPAASSNSKKENNALRAEIKRLRKVLRDIASIIKKY
jgi:regulator of replication initiation timing